MLTILIISITVFHSYIKKSTVQPQWLEHLLDHGNLFEIWVVRATERQMVPGQENNGNNLGKIFFRVSIQLWYVVFTH